ncbi:MAG: GFA family protein [Pseudomonadales bacterium]|nr:GFA family protein [Pseudomonadales bacterium]
MNEKKSTQECHCQCGDAKFTVQGEPIVRMFCHCTICQEFNDSAYSDVSIFLSKDISFDDKEKVNFKKYKSPPAVQRGKCITCNKAVIEFLNLPLFPALTIIPSENIPAGQFLIEPSTHIFYHRRVEDINDDLPKCSGFIQSQMALSIKLFSEMFRRLISA